jgi:BASS family bile acid:Na+ symporter
MQKFLSAISKGLPLWVILGATAAYFWPQAFQWTNWPLSHLLGGFLVDEHPAAATSRFDLAGQKTVSWMFAVTMFAVGTVIEPKNFVVLARRPLAVFLGLLTQFSVMPALAWLTAFLGGFDPDVTLGFIIVGCAPGAMTSNVLTYLARGDTAYSVTLTTFASVLSVVITPFLVGWLGGGELGVSPEHFWTQLWTISWTVALPLLFGIGLRVIFPFGRRLYDAVSPAIAVVAIVFICCFVIQWTHNELAAATGAIFLGVVLMNAMGFALGGFLARIYRLSRSQKITLSIEIGMQNAGIGVILAATTFADRKAVAIPAALFSIWCILTAAGLISLLKRRAAAAGK